MCFTIEKSHCYKRILNLKRTLRHRQYQRTCCRYIFINVTEGCRPSLKVNPRTHFKGLEKQVSVKYGSEFRNLSTGHSIFRIHHFRMMVILSKILIWFNLTQVTSREVCGVFPDCTEAWESRKKWVRFWNCTQNHFFTSVELLSCLLGHSHFNFLRILACIILILSGNGCTSKTPGARVLFLNFFVHFN